jgi:hypothetical protein
VRNPPLGPPFLRSVFSVLTNSRVPQFTTAVLNATDPEWGDQFDFTSVGPEDVFWFKVSSCSFCFPALPSLRRAIAC